MKVGTKSGNWSGKFELLFRVQTSFVFFSFPLKTAEVWDLETQKQLFEFTSAHGEAETTCLTFNSSGRSCISFYACYTSAGIIAGAYSRERGVWSQSQAGYRMQRQAPEDMELQQVVYACSEEGQVVCKFLEDWKIFKGHKWEWTVLFFFTFFIFPCRRKALWDLRLHLCRGEQEQVRSPPALCEPCPRARCIGWEFMLQVIMLFCGKFLPWDVPQGLVRLICFWKKRANGSGWKRTKINLSRSVVQADGAAQPEQAGSGCPWLGLHTRRVCASQMVF